ncbi:sulfate reduction electron transfer complex DsrMKJOP subunit DsrO [Chloroflexota bacterium]
MQTNRRGFIKVAGLAALGFVVAKPVFDFFVRMQSTKASTTALTPAQTTTTTKWGMAINMKACSERDDCRECINACHSYHNVPDIDNKEEGIKWIYKAPFEKVFPEHENEFIASGMKEVPIILLCNHCKHPPCIKVCPTKATWKREDGIVMMDYHRCIGCRYCMGGCPYGSRSFNWKYPRPFIREVNPDFPTRTRGVVEKCNFCAKRLSQGLSPACVEACPEKALTFGNLLDHESEISEILRTHNIIRRLPELGTDPNIYYYG